MDIWIFLLLLGINRATGVTHSLKYFYTASSQVPNFPEFVIVGMVDGVPTVHYDSNTRRLEPKQDWMNRIRADDPQNWQTQTDMAIDTHHIAKANIELAKQSFNQTGGVHIYQVKYGCEWDDENNEVTGYEQHGYDGEDFIAFDLKRDAWITPKQEAFTIKLKLDSDKAFTALMKNYLTHICPEWLKKYVNYGRRSLLRTVHLLQKSPSSPVSCHATGFYPDRATMFWRKDGQELHEDVDHGEILPNHDGTFQMRVDLNISSVKPEDWRRYDCVFQLSGVNDDVTIQLDKSAIRTNWEKPSDMFIPMIAAGAVLLILLLVVIGLVMYKVNKAQSSAQKLKTQFGKDPSRRLNRSASSSNSSSTVTLSSTSPMIPGGEKEN